jgi:probable H4MPT-linked C1 transfer pathway protein
MRWWGIDVGGANLKWVDPAGRAATRPFPLWQRPGDLAAELTTIFAEIAPGEGVAATMTGELCDCFETKAEGVSSIVAALRAACGEARLAIYGTDGRLHAADQITRTPLLAAASNWHALATFSARWLPGGTGMLIDIGSTTSDLIPLRSGKVATSSVSDTERLSRGELVYSGVARTPLMALVSTLPYRGGECPVAAELFASTADVYYLLSDSTDEEEGGWTADGRPMTRQFAIDRLARSICADRTTFDEQDALVAAQWVKEKQLFQLRRALEKVLEQYPDCGGDVVIAGSGERLAREVATGCPGVRNVISLGERLGPTGSGGAAAVAVATLARELLEEPR